MNVYEHVADAVTEEAFVTFHREEMGLMKSSKRSVWLFTQDNDDGILVRLDIITSKWVQHLY